MSSLNSLRMPREKNPLLPENMILQLHKMTEFSVRYRKKAEGFLKFCFSPRVLFHLCKSILEEKKIKHICSVFS